MKSTAKREEGKGIEGVVGIGKVCCHVRVSRNWEEFWDWVDTSGLQLRGTCDLGLQGMVTGRLYKWFEVFLGW